MSLRDHLQAIYDERGELTPALVVAVARDDRHPLHDRFDWNNTTASEKWRRHQAHELIKSVRITYTSSKTGALASIRAFHATREPETNRYVYQPTEVVMQNPMAMRLLLAEMERDWQALKRRWEEVEEFWDMVGGDLRNVA
jgi:hypothetical protein